MRLELDPKDRPYLPRGVRMHKDRVRGGTVLLAPEKAILLDDIGVAILSRVDGTRSFGEIIPDLAQAFKAPPDQIETDVQRLLGGLRARMYLGVRP